MNILLLTFNLFNYPSSNRISKFTLVNSPARNFALRNFGIEEG